MAYTDVDSFKSFGTNFQNCVLQAALIDREFFEKSFEVLKEELNKYEVPQIKYRRKNAEN